jgi:RNA polymerase sigma-70 factor (ECF subfamily)
MSADAHRAGAELEEFRDDLRDLAQKQLDRRLWDRVDLSGLIQKTLLEAWQAWEQFQQLGAADRKPWLRRVLVNNLKDALDQLRTQRRDVRRERSLDEAREDSSTRVQAWLASEESSPSQKAIRQEEAQRLKARLEAALAGVSPERRKALELHLEKRTLEEIAKEMGKSKTAVAQLVHRGIGDLNRLLDQQ